MLGKVDRNFMSPLPQYLFLMVFITLAQSCVFLDGGTAPPVPPLVAPSQYGKEIAALQDADLYVCEAIPEPYTGPLNFSSKYEGSGKSRSALNKQAAEKYHQQTSRIFQFEKNLIRMSEQYIRTGEKKAANCLMLNIDLWAKSSALLSNDINQVGQSVRKWVLASAGIAYLKVMQSKPDYSFEDPGRQKRILNWFDVLSTEVIGYYSNRPLNKVNNHDYWAAWAVMVSAINLNDQARFNWAILKYRQGISQIDKEGILPNELRRANRALQYHNFAMQPLIMLSGFIKSNGAVLTDKEEEALVRLAERVVAGIQDNTFFENSTGVNQNTKNLDSSWSLAWLEPFTHYYDSDKVRNFKPTAVRPYFSTRLGGELTKLFGNP